LNPGRRGGKPATNRLNYGAANPSVDQPVASRYTDYAILAQKRIYFVLNMMFIEKNRRIMKAYDHNRGAR
jgi:hypothetical protein